MAYNSRRYENAHWAVTCSVCDMKPIRFETIDNYDPSDPPILQGNLENTFPARCPRCNRVYMFKRKEAWLDVSEM